MSIQQERMTIQGGLGPIQATSEDLTFQIAPLTVLIGPQGTGKSLISQLLYFLRDAEYLLSRGSIQGNENELVGSVMGEVRAGGRNARSQLVSFLTTPKAYVEYEGSRHLDNKVDRKIGFYDSNRTIQPIGTFRKEVKTWLQEWNADQPQLGRITQKALFAPAERTFFSRFVNNPSRLFDDGLNLSAREFANILQGTALDIHELWQSDPKKRPDAVRIIDKIIAPALGGEGVFVRRGPNARTWGWIPSGSEKSHAIDLASSGQMATWPLIAVIQSLFDMPLDERPTYLHIEEPETHLHPLAQIALAKVFTFLVNQGFRIFITTHSLFMLYAINNLTLAKKQLNEDEPDGMPPQNVRISPDKVAAYLAVDQTLQSITDPTGQIDESRLGEVLGDLEVQYNRLMTYKILWE